jgi:acyl-[acyl-carrier-protein]-phospholipid O-acyltransferase/long-chain-fatty-acid--[acyl-carrier-protein] ligase
MTAPNQSITPPSRRHWVGFWSMIVQQTQNAFNDKVAQFMLVSLGGAVGVAVESWAAILISLPYVLFAPLAGWMSDRYSKRDVMLGAALAQIIILAAICGAVVMRDMRVAMLGFFLLATQAAFFSPAKIGSNKELLGSQHLGFASGIQQMTTMLGMLAGQILAGWIYDSRYRALGATEDVAWSAALLPMVILTLTSVPALLMAWVVPRVPAQGGAPLRPGVLIQHFGHLKDLWRDAPLRRASFGMAFFWGFATFINLWSVKLAKAMTGGHGGFGTLSSEFMGAASLGMIGGFGLAAFLLRRRIELGWVPVAGVAMTVLALIVACIPLGGWWFMAMLVLLALCSAVFLAPLNAWVQDRYPADKRGELQSAVNLQDCFAGMVAAALIEVIALLTNWFGIDAIMGLRVQIAFAGVICALMTWFIIRLLPGPFIRVFTDALVRSVYHVRTVNFQRLPQQGGVLLLPNHVTFADAFFIAAACRRPVRFVMDEGFMKHPAVRWFVSIFDTVSITREQPREAIRRIIGALRQGDTVCLFPEGTLTRTGTLSKLQRGFELIANKAGHPLVPMWCEGLWGSIFSFERGRFFSKWPNNPFRYGLTVAFGETLAPATATLEALRDAILHTSAEAIDKRFRAPGWGVRVPRGAAAERVRNFTPDARRRMWINGYQIGQINALQRRQAFAALAGEPLLAALPGLFLAFAELYKAPLQLRAMQQAQDGGCWVGGDTLRTLLESAAPEPEPGIVFYDFSEHANVPLERVGVLHCPCLALEGVVVAMSMPDPAPPDDVRDAQYGRKPGSWGTLLPGWFLVQTADGRLSAHGPAAPAAGLALPHGCLLDGDGFLVQGYNADQHIEVTNASDYEAGINNDLLIEVGARLHF